LTDKPEKPANQDLLSGCTIRYLASHISYHSISFAKAPLIRSTGGQCTNNGVTKIVVTGGGRN